MKRFCYFEGALGSGKSMFIMHQFIKYYKHNIKKYKWKKYVLPFINFDYWQFRNYSILINNKFFS